MAKKPKLTQRQKRQVAANRSKRLQGKHGGQDGQQQAHVDESQLAKGTVIGRFGKHADVEDSHGNVSRCHIRRTVDSVVCGDNVLFSKGDDAESGVKGVIEIVNDRHSVLTRPDFYDGIKPIAANIDNIIVVSAILPSLSTNIIDRYLVACEDIGITPIFEEVGGERGLRLLNQGMTDADVIRYDVASQQDNNILIVEPALSHGASYLLCMRKVKCDKSIIDDPNSAIAATTRFFDNMKAKPSELAANIFEFDDFHHVISLLLNGRFNYAILPSDNSEHEEFKRAGIEYVPLVEHALVHVIHKKHEHLLDKLSQAIAKQLNEAKP